MKNRLTFFVSVISVLAIQLALAPIAQSSAPYNPSEDIFAIEKSSSVGSTAPSSGPVGYLWTEEETSWGRLAAYLDISAKSLAELNMSDQSNSVPAGILILVPVEDLSPAARLKVRYSASAQDGVEFDESFAGRLGEKLNTSLTPEALTQDAVATASAMSGGRGTQEILEGTLYAKANAAMSAMVDASAESIRELSRVKTLETSISTPFGKGSASFSADSLIALTELNDEGRFAFTQLGVRYKGGRFTSNYGLGYRWLSPEENFALGLNTFLDWDMSGAHVRIGSGGELKTNYFDSFVNAYAPVSDWRGAYEMNEFYEEKPASGYDFGVKGTIPLLRAFEWKAKYFQWYGENVDTFDKKEYVKNPDGVELSLKWRPVQAFNIGLTHARVKSTTSQDTRLEAQFEITFDQMASLFEPVQSSPATPLRDSLHKLVERENNIVMKRRVTEAGIAAGIRIVRIEKI